MAYRKISQLNNFLSTQIGSILALLCLLYLFAYTYTIFFKIPYTGLLINYFNAQIDAIIYDPEVNAPFEIGDVIVAIDRQPFLSNLTNIKIPLIPNLSTGEVVEVTILRDGLKKTVDWLVPGFNYPELLVRFKDGWFIAYVYWLFGTLTVILVRPRDIRWYLFILFCFVMAIWLMAGIISYSGFWSSSRIMHATSWLVLAVSLHFHWVFPEPLRNRPFPFPHLLYAICISLCLAEWFLLMPYYSYLVAISLGVIGNCLLFVLHVWSKNSQSAEAQFIITLLILFFVLIIELSVLLILSGIFFTGFLALAILTFVPAGYFLAIYSGQSPGLRIRPNAKLSRLTYFLLMSVPSILVLILFKFLGNTSNPNDFLIISLSFLVGFFIAYYYPRYYEWFNQKFIGIQTPSTRLIQRSTKRLASSLEMEGFVNFLKNDIFPSLLIKEVLIAQFTSSTNGNQPSGYQIVLTMGIPTEDLPSFEDLEIIASIPQNPGNTARFDRRSNPNNWWLLSLPLLFNNEIIGVCLFGCRDPDDFYPPDDVQILQAILNQLSFALIHLKQTEQLRAFYYRDVQQMEEERLNLAQELHDDILGQLAFIVQRYHKQSASNGHIQSLQEIIQRIRQIILGLRTSALNYGLKSALDDLVDQLLDQYENTQSLPDLSIEVHGDGFRYPPEVELNIYRIVQQACQNSIIHAHPKSILISGHLYEDEVNINIKDDGVGFEIDPNPDLENLLLGGHFGLVGMHERAAFINAKLGIRTSPGNGTQVEILWEK